MGLNAIPEVITLGLSIIFTIVYYNVKDSQNERSRLFGYSACMVVLCSISNLLFELCKLYSDIIPNSVSYIIISTFYLILLVLPILFCYSMISLIHGKVSVAKQYMAYLFVPYFILAAIVLTSPITHLVYYFDEFGFHEGPLFYISHAFMFCNGVVIVITAFKNRELISKRMLRMLFVMPFLMPCVMSLKIFYPGTLLAGLSCFVTLLVLYMSSTDTLANLDRVTGLPLKSSFIELIEKKLECGQTFDLIVISVEKVHIHGLENFDDKELVEYQIISSYLKSIAPKNSVFRIGEHEFVIVLNQNKHKKISSDSEGNLIINTILYRFTKPIVVEELEHYYRARIGMLRCPDHAKTIESVFALFKYAISMAKLDNKSNVYKCDDITYALTSRKRQIYDIMFKELETGAKQFEVVYQPIYSTNQKRFVAAEALLRFYDPFLGVIPPSEFIPIAEETGLILRIGRVVVETVFQTLKELEFKQLDIAGISINYSVIQMLHEGIVEEIKELIKKYQVNPRKVRIEITESVIIDQYEEIKNVMNRLADMGIQFYLDDFGVGYSNVSNVIELPFTCIKFDKSLIWSCLTNQKCAAIVSGLANTFHSQSIYTLAEGVETEEQVALMNQYQVDFIQGFYYSKPINKSQYIDFLESFSSKEIESLPC